MRSGPLVAFNQFALEEFGFNDGALRLKDQHLA